MTRRTRQTASLAWKLDEETPGGTYTLFVHEVGNTSVQASATITVTGLPDAAEVNGKQYKSLPRALDAAQDGDTIKLAADVENCGMILIGNGGIKRLTVDLNGYNIGFAANNCFQVYGGELNVIGTGTIYEESPYYSPIMMYGSNEDIADYSVVTIGENVTSKGWSGLFIDQNGDANYGMKANVYGTLVSVLDRTGAAGHGLYVNGNIKNSVNLPNVSQEWSGIARLCMIHKNVPAMLTQIMSTLSDDGINVENMTNKSRKDYAYTIVDVNTRLTDEVADELRAIPNMIRVRVLNH